MLLSLDNLSGEDSLSWMREAVPSAAAAQLTGVGRILPFRADTSREAAALAATQMVHGYFDRRAGRLHFEFSIEDTQSHSMRPLSLDADALHAAEAIAKLLDSAAARFSTQNPQAMEAWGKGDFGRAVEMDPDFGAAWRDMLQASPSAERAEQALTRKTLRSPVERAQIQLLHAQLRANPQEASQARAELVRLVPLDAALLNRFAVEETNARNFAQAVQFYQMLLRAGTGDPTIGNFLGYAQFFAGDLASARKSFEEYSHLPGQEANGLDSQGEVLFMAGQFAEAEKLFLRAHDLSPNLLGGGDLQKAAYARWLSGDLAGADSIFDKYLKYRLEHSDKTETWRRATWDYATGREAAALDRLAKVTGPSAPLAQAQLQVLQNREKLLQSVLTTLSGLEASFKATPPAADGLVRVLYAKGLLQAGRRAEAEKMAALWPLPESGEASLQPLLYPLYLELRKNLGKQ